MGNRFGEVEAEPLHDAPDRRGLPFDFREVSDGSFVQGDRAALEPPLLPLLLVSEPPLEAERLEDPLRRGS